MEKRILSSLGLCAKAGKLIFGTSMVVEAMQKGKKVYLVLEASDTSDNTHKKLTDKCNFYGVKKIRLPFDSSELGDAVGKSSMLAAVAVTDEGFYKMLGKYFSEQ